MTTPPKPFKRASGPHREGFAVIDDDLLLIGLWAWMRANPSCSFAEFKAARARALALLS